MAPTTTSKDAPFVPFTSSPKDQKFVSGIIKIMIFLIIWICSMLVPFLIIGAIFAGQMKAAGVMIAAVLIAYMPWGRNAYLRPFFGDGFEKYFKESSLLFENGVPHKTREDNLYCVHPHGIFCMGWSVLFCHEEMQNVNFLFSTFLYNTPFFQLLTKLVGFPSPADKVTFQKLMKSKKPMALLPGGFEEATIHSDSAHRVFCKTRMGFVKYALENGYSLTPVYCFGENKTYSNAQGLWKLRLWLNELGLPAVAPFGTWWLPLLPRDKKMHIVVGKPIQPKSGGAIAKPSKEQVKEYHTQYCNALTELFDKHKKNYGEGESSLEFW